MWVIQSVDNLINKVLELDSIPVVPIGISRQRSLNINADITTVELVKAINPYKAIFLSEIGGIFNKTGQLIPNINLALEYNSLCKKNGYILNETKIRANKSLLDHLQKQPLYMHPINLPKELFTDSGSGTLIKHIIVLFNINSQT